MKKIFLIIFILSISFLIFSCDNKQNIEFYFINPIDGDYINKGSLIIVEFSSTQKINSLNLSAISGSIKRDLDYEIKENRLYSYFPEDLPDSEYKILVSFYHDKNFFEKSLNVILNSEIPIWENFIFPTNVRSGKHILIETFTSTPFKEVYVIMDDGLKINLEYLEEKNLWRNYITISHFLVEGSHILTFIGIDLKGEVLEDKKVFTVINSDPVIYSPLNGLETTSNQIDIFGFYEPDKEIMLYLNNYPFKKIKVDASGNFYDNIFLLPGYYSIYAKDLNSQFLSESSLQNIKVSIFSEGIITLCYHNISDKGGNLYTVDVEDFEEQIKYMKDNGYTSISIKDLINYYDLGIRLPKKAVLITFDDGLEGVYKFAYPILKKYGFKAVFFVISGRVDRVSNFVNWNELKEMVNDGVFEIGSHTHDSHKTYYINGKFVSILSTKIDNEDYDDFKNRVVNDLEKSKSEIEKNIGNEVVSFAYPYGEYSIDTINFLKDSGFKFAFTVIKGINTKTTPKFELRRYSIYRGTDIKQIIN
ncbi:MAG: polysaccharide deacetylase family protein [Caldisericia bacterium]